MEKNLRQLERILGGIFERADSRVIPGSIPVEGTEIVYFSDDGENTFKKQFSKLTEYTNPPYAKSGGANEQGCKITLPTGQIFHAIGYHGDVEGWRKDIEVSADAQYILLARIRGNDIAICDGRSFALDKYTVEFT